MGSVVSIYGKPNDAAEMFLTQQVGELMLDSHASLRDDYEANCLLYGCLAAWFLAHCWLLVSGY